MERPFGVQVVIIVSQDTVDPKLISYFQEEGAKPVVVTTHPLAWEFLAQYHVQQALVIEPAKLKKKFAPDFRQKLLHLVNVEMISSVDWCFLDGESEFDADTTWLGKIMSIAATVIDPGARSIAFSPHLVWAKSSLYPKTNAYIIGLGAAWYLKTSHALRTMGGRGFRLGSSLAQLPQIFSAKNYLFVD